MAYSFFGSSVAVSIWELKHDCKKNLEANEVISFLV